ncbi:receptor-like protein kinase 7 [Hordeum vulgare subsp. vulgare]|uniref:Protein kinase domain-containing protein n=1 Tax=Hordeum vulgare subsp. vulgare TaxID=112509 RepID=A0A8I6YPT1_HORVV|nr:receptor-like protein kinase 7 [Hordeum vulgare subsp. vulgare]XP_044956040.1 receptor-like protein kinase 7 [Hordeum vulgare subsp. vulgare]
MSLQYWNHPAAVQHILLNEQAAIVNNLTENNMTRMWASRRIAEGDQLYVVQGITGISPPYTLLVKKFHNVNPALQVDDNVKYRCKSEMFLLASISQKNIIKVVDHIEREDAIMLVYEYPVYGSLQSWLHQPMDVDAGQHLSWPHRRGIAIGVAKGLRHLHHRCSKPFVHHNINSKNILLDVDFKAVIASFGVAQVNMAGLGQPLPITDLPPGNFGYVAPEYGMAANQLTEKVDVYSFGVVLLELVTGRVANGGGADGHLANWAWKNFDILMANQQEAFQNVVDRGIPDQARYMEEMATVFRLGVDCTTVDPKQRPSMRMAIKQLRRCRGRVPFRGLLTRYLL